MRGTGYEIFEDSTGRFGKLPKVIILTTFDWDEHAATAIRHGASGFILKDSTPECVCESIRALNGGNAVIAPQSLAARRAGTGSRGSRQYLELANQEISDRLLLGGPTVKPHIGAILRKLGLRDRMQIVVYSCENGIGR